MQQNQKSTSLKTNQLTNRSVSQPSSEPTGQPTITNTVKTHHTKIGGEKRRNSKKIFITKNKRNNNHCNVNKSKCNFYLQTTTAITRAAMPTVHKQKVTKQKRQAHKKAKSTKTNTAFKIFKKK